MRILVPMIGEEVRRKDTGETFSVVGFRYNGILWLTVEDGEWERFSASVRYFEVTSPDAQYIEISIPDCLRIRE